MDDKEKASPQSAERNKTYTTSNTTAQVSTRTAWTPQIIHWRGWSLYGSDPSTRLDKKEGLIEWPQEGREPQLAYAAPNGAKKMYDQGCMAEPFTYAADLDGVWRSNHQPR